MGFFFFLAGHQLSGVAGPEGTVTVKLNALTDCLERVNTPRKPPGIATCCPPNKLLGKAQLDTV